MASLFLPVRNHFLTLMFAHLSTGNNPSFEALLDTMQHIAKDSSDPSSQKAAFLFLTRCVGSYGMPITSPTSPTMQNGASQRTGLPGFERIVYEQLVPTAFAVPSAPDFNPKDGQTVAVRHLSLQIILPYMT
jgi:exportin-T